MDQEEHTPQVRSAGLLPTGAAGLLRAFAASVK